MDPGKTRREAAQRQTGDDHFKGKEGVDGSSPSEGFRKGQQMAFFVV
jgi:hypothetical protein